MDEKQQISENTLRVQGTDKVEVPAEVRDFYQGKGMPVDFLKSHYGVDKGISIKPQTNDMNAQLLGLSL